MAKPGISFSKGIHVELSSTRLCLVETTPTSLGKCPKEAQNESNY